MESTIKGSVIVLDERRIKNILEMLRAGTCVPRLEKKLDGLKCIVEREEVNEVANLFSNQLSVEMRLLHNIVSHFSPQSW